MSKVALSGNASGTGTVTIAAPNTSTDRTINLPDSNGTILTTATPGVPVNGPAFSAYASGATTVPNVTNTKILFAAEEFDTNSNFASSRFTPTVAGYYQINATLYGLNTTGVGQLLVYKNGVLTLGGAIVPAASAIGCLPSVSALVYANGSTDYFEIYFYQNSGSSTTTSASQSYTYFQGFLARSAT
jgi:hypothetical protein